MILKKRKEEGRTKSFKILPGAFYGHGARFAASFSKITPEGENDTRNVTLNQVGKRTDPIPREVILVFFMGTLGFISVKNWEIQPNLVCCSLKFF